MKVCEMCGEPGTEYFEAGINTDELGYCNGCKDHTVYIEEEEDD